MNTDDLIRALAADTEAEASLSGRMWLVLVPALILALAALWLTLGFRPDLAEIFGNARALIRWGLTITLALVSIRIALVLARPEGRSVVRLWPLAVVAGAATGTLIWAYVTTPAEGLQMAVVGKTIWTCLVAIPTLSVLPVGALFWAARRGATRVPALTGAVIGLAGSAAAAAVYATYCIEDSPLFYVTWYSLAIIGVTLVSAAVGQRILRW